MKRRSVVVALAALLVLAMATPAYAGGKGKGKPKPTEPTTATLNVSCDPCEVRETAYFTGSGYDGSQGRALVDIGGAFMNVGVTPSGEIAFQWSYFSVPGDYVVNVSQDGKGKKKVLKASTTVAVVSP